MASTWLRFLAAGVSACLLPCVFAQMQPHARIDGELLPVFSYDGQYLTVTKNGKKQRSMDLSAEIRPADSFGEGRVEITDVQTDQDPLRDATVKERSRPDAVQFRYVAKVRADRSLSSCYGLLTFCSQGSIGTQLVYIGSLSANSPKTVKVEVRSNVEIVGNLHVFSAGHEVASNLRPAAYDVHQYWTELAGRSKGLPAAELLKFEDVFPHQLSRDGLRLATVRKKDGKKILMVFDLTTVALVHQQVVTEADDHLGDLTWISDHELAYIVEDDDRDGNAKWWLQLHDIQSGATVRLMDECHGIIHSLDDQPHVLVVSSYDYMWMTYDVRTRKGSKVDEPEAGYYLFDRKGVARLRYWIDGDTTRYQIKSRSEAGWKELDEVCKVPGLRFNIKGSELLDRMADVHSVGPDGDILYISTRLGTDQFQLAAFSMSEGVIKKTIAKHPKYDLTVNDSGRTRLLFAKNKPDLLGIVFDAQKRQVVWLNPTFAAIQKNIDGALPNRFNNPIDWSDDGSAMIYFSSCDQDPGTFYIYRPQEGTLIPVHEISERLKDKPMGKTTPFEFVARDGVKIPAYVTRPPEVSGPAPLIVNIHGGPMARDGWGFDPLNQFLASRGYIVLQVNYRGSSGYGAAFQKAGLQARLDTVVLDDIVDGVQHMIKSGEIDPKRIGVMGASFGGWATYMSLIKYPELFRAGIAVSAVSHWRTTLKDGRWGFNTQLGHKFWKTLLGRENFAAEEKFIDPYLRASELKQPIYIMHGGLDFIVKPVEAQLMLEALRKTNPHVQTRLFPRSSHSGWPYNERVTMFNEVASFFARYLAPLEGAEAAADAPAQTPASAATAAH